MPQFFGRRWNAVARLSLYGSPVALAAIGLAGWLLVRSPYWTEVGVPVEQPVPFPHDVHSGRLGLDCRYCHATSDTAAFAGMPATEVCMNCHTHIWTALPALEPVRSSYATGLPLAWKRVHDLPDYSYFHHGIHSRKGIGCASCHGRVDQMAVVHKTETLYMQWCLDCHREPEKYVRPREEVFNMAWAPPTDPQELQALGRRLGIDPPPTNPHELGVALVEKYGVRRETSCSRCHR